MAEQTPKMMPPGVWDTSSIDGYRQFQSFDDNGKLVRSYLARADVFEPSKCEEMQRELDMVNRNLRAIAALPQPLQLLA